MGRMLTAILFVFAAVLLFHYSGVLNESPSVTSYALRTLGITEPQNFGSTSFFLTLFGITAISVSGIIIGSLIRLDPNTLITISIGVPLSIFLFSIGWDLILIFNELAKASVPFAVIVTSPLLFGYFFTIFDWIRGRD